MDFDGQYLIPDSVHWQGRVDSPLHAAFFQCVQSMNLTASPQPAGEHLSFVLLGFACDEGIRRNLGRPGACEGPDALRRALARLPVHRENMAFHDAGTIVCRNRDLESAQAALAEAVFLLLSLGHVPLLVGGGHEMAWGHWQGIVRGFPSLWPAIINMDTHFDMRPLLPGDRGSSGTPFLQIANAHRAQQRTLDYNCIGIGPEGNTKTLFETANAYGVRVLRAEDMQRSSQVSEDFVGQILENSNAIYLSLCLDVMSSAYAPGVSAPASLGLTPWQVMSVVRQVAASGKAVSYDIAELSPPLDVDARTAKLAASLVHAIVHHHQKVRQGS